MQIQPYLFFEGRCEEAMEFYRKAVGAKVEMMMRYKDAPQPTTHGSPEKVMHASVKIGQSTISMSDGECTGKPDFKGFSLTAIVGSEAEAEKVFGTLADGGQVAMPLGQTFFSPKFGMLKDRFGMKWMVYVAG